MRLAPRLLSFEEADRIMDGVLSSTFQGGGEARGATADIIVVSGDLTVRGDIAQAWLTGTCA